ncbi:MAG TPA: TIGR03067 domain-containing protein [Blastocatellia bacterium]|nr:TIGR03067 domain-containing protein [Blastocatellia bacterium]
MIGKLLLLLSVCCLVFMPLRTLNAEDENKVIEGTWIVVAGELGGQKLPGESLKDNAAGSAAGKLILTDGHYTYQNDQGTYKLNPAEKPKTMDITGMAGPNQGKTLLAIYEVTGDTLKICYDLGGKTRPSEFTTTAGTKQFLAVYKRAKD